MEDEGEAMNKVQIMIGAWIETWCVPGAPSSGKDEVGAVTGPTREESTGVHGDPLLRQPLGPPKLPFCGSPQQCCSRD